jgi:hypothetical protein
MVAPAATPLGDAARLTSEGWVDSAPRRELKYAGPASRGDGVEALLASLCAADDRFPENVVHTVYFDSRRLVAYDDKANGQYAKEKLRLRWYEPATGEAWLEMKIRRGALGWKRRKRVGFRPPGAVLEEDLAAVAREHLGVALPPSCWIAYRRLRRVTPDGSARVALDREIRVEWVSPAVPRRRGEGSLPFFVVEVKGESAEPPAWLSRAIGRFARRTAFSKYAMCLEYVGGGWT